MGIPSHAQKGNPADYYEAAAAIEMAKAIFPFLTNAGMLGPDRQCRGMFPDSLNLADFDRSRSEFEPANVATAIAYLRQCGRIKRLSSYTLKHCAEHWGRDNGIQPYLSNGELIVAAAYLGFKIKIFTGYGNVEISGRARRCCLPSCMILEPRQS